ncbi:LCP family protein [Candidatus Gottesmanbacteria bacterium]|nr:LCP family protein [Candidatus Gottesmanbacteria bacterium]
MQLKFKRKIIKYLHILQPTIKVGIFFLVAIIAWRLVSPIYNFSRQNQFSKDFFLSILLNRDPPLKKYLGRTNIILLGIGGGQHEGGDLTDAMIFFSIDYQKKDIVEVSVPRDLWSVTLKDKINTAYHYGEEKKKGGGLILAKAIVEEIVGQPVHYAWLIDFSGFKKLIDLVGGVDIDVKNPFIDKEYPIESKENDFCGGDPTFACRYETLKFDGGLQHMDGEKALKFVRSRHAEGEEGTDFARSRRQQLVISSLKNRLLKPKFFWQNLKHAEKLFSAFDDATDTDMNLSEQILFLKSFLKLPEQNIRKIVLDNGDDEKGIKGFLVNPPVWQYNGEWLLIPRKGEGNFDEIHNYISCNIENTACTMRP